MLTPTDITLCKGYSLPDPVPAKLPVASGSKILERLVIVARLSPERYTRTEEIPAFSVHTRGNV